MKTNSLCKEANIFSYLLSAEERADPYHLYEELRREADVYCTGNGLWFIMGYDRTAELLRHPETRIDDRNSIPYRNLTNDGYQIPEYLGLPLLIRIDPPDHSRIRGLVQQAFTPRRIEELRHRVERLVECYLGEIGNGNPIDIVPHLARRLPMSIITSMLGVPEEDSLQLSEWSEWVTRSLDPRPFRTEETNSGINRAMHSMVGYLRDMVTERRSRPGGDLVSALGDAYEEDHVLSEDELMGMLVLLFVAGHETISAMIANGINALAGHPEQLRKLREAGPALGRAATDEILRFDTPTQFIQRTANVDIDLGGVILPADNIVVMMLGSANRDPSVFPEPDRLDLARRPNPHLAFGRGLHHCLGSALAHLEGDVLFPEIGRRFQNIEIHERVLRPTYVLRGYEKLVVTFRW